MGWCGPGKAARPEKRLLEFTGVFRFARNRLGFHDHDFFFLHVKKTDSYGEDGDEDAKAGVIMRELGVDRETAYAIASGVYRVSRDPVSQQAQVIDMTTGAHVPNAFGAGVEHHRTACGRRGLCSLLP